MLVPLRGWCRGHSAHDALVDASLRPRADTAAAKRRQHLHRVTFSMCFTPPRLASPPHFVVMYRSRPTRLRHTHRCVRVQHDPSLEPSPFKLRRERELAPWAVGMARVIEPVVLCFSYDEGCGCQNIRSQVLQCIFLNLDARNFATHGTRSFVPPDSDSQ